VKEVPGVMAFKVFEDYDGMGSTFGDGSLRATSADQGKLAIYAAERSSDHMLTVLVLNKSFGDLTGSVALTTTAKVAQVYRYSNGDLNEIRKLADAKVTKSGIAATFPAQSLTLFVLAR
jgi:O-glycosyl hydrolase